MNDINAFGWITVLPAAVDRSPERVRCSNRLVPVASHAGRIYHLEVPGQRNTPSFSNARRAKYTSIVAPGETT